MYKSSPKINRTFLYGVIISVVGSFFLALELKELMKNLSVGVCAAAGLLCFAVCCFVNFSHCNKLLTKEQQACLQLLWYQCDPKKFVAAYRPIATAKKSGDSFSLTYRCQLANGYTALGDYEEAVEILNEVKATKKNDANAQYVRQAELFLGEPYFMMNDLAGLRQCREDSKELLTHLHEMARLYPIAKSRSDRNEQLEAILSGEHCEEAADFFTRAAEQDTTPYMQVLDRYYLSRAYRALGNFAEEKQQLKQVAESKGTMAVTQEAKRRLKELKEQKV